MHNYSVLVQDVVKSYGKQQILKKLCMKVEKGEIYGLLGASGCGKTTLLSTIVGRKKIESGEIWVLGEKPGEPGSGVPGLKVGYMPQETALVREFTVKDAVFYFGRIYHMKEKLIEKRYRELSDLLDLPPDNRYLKDCSGGQQRRVSFAVALVHKPQLLILDEPTVGIDPILREKIWSYLIDISKQEKISVIITTHYIEECRQADKIGLMREGRLLAEESPNRLLTIFNKDTLEEVFLLLSRQQEEGQLPLEDLSSPENVTDLKNNVGSSTFTISSSSQSIADGYKSTDELTKKPRPSFNIMNKKRMRALLDKNSKQFYRNSTSVAFLLGMPLIQMLLMIYSIGLDMKNIPIGIVNDESMSAFCPNFSIIGTAQSEDIISDCHFENLSCRFLKHLDNNPMITKIQYNTLEEANDSAIHGKVTGIMYFPQNFSAAFEERLNEGREAEQDMIKYGEIKVRLDMSNQQIGNSVKRKLYDLYIEFQKALYTDCRYVARAADLPVKTEFIYGLKDEPFQLFVIPGIIVTMMFLFGSMMTSQIMVTEKHEGIWDRSIVAGVTSTELTMSHLSFQGIIAIFQAMEMILTVYIIYEYQYVGSFWLMYVIVYLQGLCGMSYGMFVSIVSTNQSMSFNAVMGFYLPTIIISAIELKTDGRSNATGPRVLVGCCIWRVLFPVWQLRIISQGCIWPIEGMPTVLQWISRILPCTFSVEAFNSVVKKGLSLTDAQVAIGLLISIAWIIIFASMSLFFLKRQR